MSEGETTGRGRYFVLDNWTTLDCRRRWVIGEAGKVGTIDMFRSRVAAERAARLLNAGAAQVDCHAVLGYKVVER